MQVAPDGSARLASIARAKPPDVSARYRCYAVDDRPWTGSTHPAAAYVFSEDRRGEHPTEHLRHSEAHYKWMAMQASASWSKRARMPRSNWPSAGRTPGGRGRRAGNVTGNGHLRAPRAGAKTTASEWILTRSRALLAVLPKTSGVTAQRWTFCDFARVSAPADRVQFVVDHSRDVVFVWIALSDR
jgi:hypothetical protein